jgi:hypothetical protein
VPKVTLSPKASTRLPAGRALSFGFLPQAATATSAIPSEMKRRRFMRTSFLFDIETAGKSSAG